MFGRVWWELCRDLPQQGPGSDESTRSALAGLGPLPANPRIADLGCGPGRQSLVLARETGGRVDALDLLPPFLSVLCDRARAAGLSDRVRPVRGDMRAPGLARGRYDLVWSEGAVYIPGFEAGLATWHSLLRPGGLAAVSECTWVSHAPEETRRFWADAYPAMADVAGNRVRAERAGYDVVDTFVLPLSDWLAYYDPMEARAKRLREKYAGDEAALEVLAGHTEEVRILMESGGCYSYVFYLLRAR